MSSFLYCINHINKQLQCVHVRHKSNRISAENAQHFSNVFDSWVSCRTEDLGEKKLRNTYFDYKIYVAANGYKLTDYFWGKTSSDLRQRRLRCDEEKGWETERTQDRMCVCVRVCVWKWRAVYLGCSSEHSCCGGRCVISRSGRSSRK